MKVLYVTAACLTKNTSANMSHNGFIKGLIDLGADVEIIMANSSWGEEDSALPKWECVKYNEFDAVSFADRLRGKLKANTLSKSFKMSGDSFEKIQRRKLSWREIAKRIFYFVFPSDPIYPLDKKWLKTAVSFKAKDKYDVVISNSSPAASHKLVSLLLQRGRVSCDRWIQIWEDPWYYDLYGGNSKQIFDEEQSLLRVAQEIYYVSPLTLMYQKKYFSDCSDKMKCVPLPFFEYGESEMNCEKNTNSEVSFGYFGDYYSKTRNLRPFYEALVESGYKGYIYGDSDENFGEYENIEISGRVTLDKLAIVQGKTKVLVHLCNLQGGQIPGKIYHYSATNKPILFILDGTAEEIAAIKNYFEGFDRYVFCNNDVESITSAMNRIAMEPLEYNSVSAFSPKNVVQMLFDNSINHS